MDEQILCVAGSTLRLYEAEAFARVEPPDRAFSPLSLNWLSGVRCARARLELQRLELLRHLGLIRTLRHATSAREGEGQGAVSLALAPTAPRHQQTRIRDDKTLQDPTRYDDFVPSGFALLAPDFEVWISQLPFTVPVC